ncbi:DUF1837 domain-containing protein [Pseudomonas sp. F(2018)]|uniref:HamA C-terminal domain-containing protein n=1 Tax=Pseudomonas sp. F(2018) TaxID=2502240 RepID=UPI0010F6BBA2|nr:DUF1837 domain-containing protein [Pseudomonas sp. F(2018)]
MQSLENLRPYIENQIFKLETINSDIFQKLHLDYDNKVYREKELGRLIRDAVEYFALTPEEFEEFSSTGNMIEARRTAWSRISDARKNSKGDYGELLLFLALYFFYPTGTPERFVTKVRLRSSTNDQIKGFDCAHFTIENDEVCLWLGEAKFHNSFNNAIAGAISSIKEHIEHDYLNREFKILGTNIEANKGISESHLLKLKNTFKGKSISNIKIKIPVLLTYDCNIIQTHESIDGKLIELLKDSFEKNKLKISQKNIVLPPNISLAFIFFPFKSVDTVKTFLESVEEAIK